MFYDIQSRPVCDLYGKRLKRWDSLYPCPSFLPHVLTAVIRVFQNQVFLPHHSHGFQIDKKCLRASRQQYYKTIDVLLGETTDINFCVLRSQNASSRLSALRCAIHVILLLSYRSFVDMLSSRSFLIGCFYYLLVSIRAVCICIICYEKIALNSNFRRNLHLFFTQY